MSSSRGCKDAIDDFERSYFPQKMSAVNVVTRDAKDQCRLLLGPVRTAGILRHPLPLLLFHRDRVRAAGVLPHPPLPLQLHRNRVRSGCITTPVAAIVVVGTSSGTAVSTLPDSVVHTRTSGKAGKRRGGEKEEGEIDCLSEQHTTQRSTHTRIFP